ncbi:MAG: SDR family oxidoreductase [Tepidisphaeraceae bacterium]|jgi:NAD(P)-dependent dehydrogenase (short-subunit alcohol dehydrogenase family)
MSQPVAIVTGAGRGIGRAVAIQLSALKYDLVLVSRTASELEATRRQCVPEAAVMPADVSSAQQVDDLVLRAREKFKRIDVLVHCAGVALARRADQMTQEEWRATIDTNLSAVFYFSRLLWPIWKSQGGGVMVNVSSLAGRDPFEGLGAYGAAKAGVNLLGVALAREGKSENIRVHTVAPGATDTVMFRSLVGPEFPQDRILDPADVARVIVQCVRGDLVNTSGEVIYVHK